MGFFEKTKIDSDEVRAARDGLDEARDDVSDKAEALKTYIDEMEDVSRELEEDEITEETIETLAKRLRDLSYNEYLDSAQTRAAGDWARTIEKLKPTGSEFDEARAMATRDLLNHGQMAANLFRGIILPTRSVGGADDLAVIARPGEAINLTPVSHGGGSMPQAEAAKWCEAIQSIATGAAFEQQAHATESRKIEIGGMMADTVVKSIQALYRFKADSNAEGHGTWAEPMPGVALAWFVNDMVHAAGRMTGALEKDDRAVVISRHSAIRLIESHRAIRNDIGEVFDSVQEAVDELV